MRQFRDCEHLSTNVHSHAYVVWIHVCTHACVPKLWAPPSISTRILFVSGESLSPVWPQTTFLERQSPSTATKVARTFHEVFRQVATSSPSPSNKAIRDPAFGLHCHSLGMGREEGRGQQDDLLTCSFAQIPFGRRVHKVTSHSVAFREDTSRELDPDTDESRDTREEKLCRPSSLRLLASSRGWQQGLTPWSCRISFHPHFQRSGSLLTLTASFPQRLLPSVLSKHFKSLKWNSELGQGLYVYVLLHPLPLCPGGTAPIPLLFTL